MTVFEAVTTYFLEARPLVTSNEKAFDNACERFETMHKLAVPFDYNSFRMRLRNKKTGVKRNTPAVITM